VDFAARIAARWQRDTVSGVDSAATPYHCDQHRLFPGYADGSEHLRRNALMNEYEGCLLDDIFAGSECHTAQGDCYAVRSSVPCSVGRPEMEALYHTLAGELCLICGIGPVTASQLRSRGYSTIESLRRHQRFGAQARTLFALLETEDWDGLEQEVRSRFRPSHPHHLLFSLLCRTDELLFFDIETMGLFSRPIILLATGRIRRGEMQITQYLLRDIGEEPAAISMVLEEMSDAGTALVTYNGRGFDLPYLRDRAAYYGMAPPPDPAHFDLLHPSRSRWKGECADCRLGTIERQALSIFRDDDLPGKDVPGYYAAYLRSQNPGPLVPIVDHNRQDVASLARLYERLLEGYAEVCPSEG